MGTNPTVIGSWFTLLEKIKKTAGITSPDQIWSGDEMGVQNVPKEVKVIGLKNIFFFVLIIIIIYSRTSKQV